MKLISSLFILADSDGTVAPLQGDYTLAPYNMPRAPNLSPQTEYFITGDRFSVEYDSTGEIYVIFSDNWGNRLSDVILLVRGMSVHITATKMTVVGIRRAGIVRLSVGVNGYETVLTNSPSGLSENLLLRYPVGVNGSTGPAGWITVPHPFGLANSYLAYNPNKYLDMAGVIGSMRRFAAGAVTAANYNFQGYGFVDVQGGVVIRFHDLYEFIGNAAVYGGGFAVDAQAYWRPAIVWGLTAAGVVANPATPDIYLETNTTYTHKRNAAQLLFDFT